MMRVVFLCLLVIGQLLGGTRAFAGADQAKRSPQGLSVFAQTRSQFGAGIASVWGEVQSKESTAAIRISQGIATTPPSKTTPTSSGKVIAFEVCSASPAWVRPESKVQMQQIKSTGRYADAKTNQEIQNLIQQFWTRNVILFASYGLSARIEPIYLSGLWTIPNTIDSISNKCYASKQRILDLNSGKKAEVWLLLHKVRSIKWLDHRYVMVVQPMSQGAQFIQLMRVEQQSTPTMQVITENGRELEVINWGANPKN
jgi:hypothetical protein